VTRNGVSADLPRREISVKEYEVSADLPRREISVKEYELEIRL
jgi:hypothetical protein